LFSDTEMTVICADNYYLPKDKVPVDSNGWQNYDTPEAIDQQLYAAHVRDLRSGIAIQQEEYTYHNAAVKPGLITLYPAPLILIEGIFSLHLDEVSDLADLKLYIDADPETRFN